MNYSISITLTEEQNDALLATVAAIKAKGGNTTAQQLLKENGVNFVNQQVEQAYNSAMRRLGDAASSLTYAARKSLIAEVESKLV